MSKNKRKKSSLRGPICISLCSNKEQCSLSSQPRLCSFVHTQFESNLLGQVFCSLLLWFRLKCWCREVCKKIAWNYNTKKNECLEKQAKYENVYERYRRSFSFKNIHKKLQRADHLKRSAFVMKDECVTAGYVRFCLSLKKVYCTKRLLWFTNTHHASTYESFSL